MTVKCPFCVETIQAGAIKRRHCGSMLNEKPRGGFNILRVCLVAGGLVGVIIFWLRSFSLLVIIICAIIALLAAIAM